MQCDQCGQTIESGPLVAVGANRSFRNLCRSCWTVETNTSNARLIEALNRMTRKPAEERGGRRAAGARRPSDGGPAEGEGEGADRRNPPPERRADPERSRWHP